MSQKTKNIILIVILIVLIFIAYSLFFKKDAGDGALVSQSALAPTGESAVVQEFLALLRTLNNLKLNTRIFENPVFNNLRDESVELLPQPQGRQNPFAPLP